MRTRIIVNHANDVRDSSWLPVQQDDGPLHVEQQVRYPDGEQKKRVVPINDFMRENGPPPRALQKLIDQIFDPA